MSPGTIAAEHSNLKTDINPLLLAIPGTCDFFGSTIMFFSLLMVPASVYQMLRGAIVIITAVLAVIFLKKKQYRHHLTSLFVIFLGLFFVGVSSIISPDKKSGGKTHDPSTVATGIVLLLIAQLFAGTQFVVEEKILSSYYLNPMRIVGWEGFFGFLYYCIALPILQQIKCTRDDAAEFCPFGRLENSVVAFYQMGQNIGILFCALGVICTIAFFNYFGVATTKYASAPQRSTVDTSRTVLIWLFFLTIPIKGAEESFHWL
jgi:drug/metabolite transporter (DMT)-like permease